MYIKIYEKIWIKQLIAVKAVLNTGVEQSYCVTIFIKIAIYPYILTPLVPNDYNSKDTPDGGFVLKCVRIFYYSLFLLATISRH